MAIKFQSTRPLRGGTGVQQRFRGTPAISIHPPLAGRDEASGNDALFDGISIHPPLAGRDLVRAETERDVLISIHPPLAGRDVGQCRKAIEIIEFQSTRPLRGGTLLRGQHQADCQYFNPPAPCGAGPKKRPKPFKLRYFNPPAPCGAGQGS